MAWTDFMTGWSMPFQVFVGSAIRIREDIGIHYSWCTRHLLVAFYSVKLCFILEYCCYCCLLMRMNVFCNFLCFVWKRFGLHCWFSVVVFCYCFFSLVIIIVFVSACQSPSRCLGRKFVNVISYLWCCLRPKSPCHWVFKEKMLFLDKRFLKTHTEEILCLW